MKTDDSAKPDEFVSNVTNLAARPIRKFMKV
jgi:hypothetical protein